jgi:hypothetical protein
MNITKGINMQAQYTSVRLPVYLMDQVKKLADSQMRSVPKQIEYDLQFARAVRDNPDLPPDFIAGILEGRREIDAGLGIPFEFKD